MFALFAMVFVFVFVASVTYAMLFCAFDALDASRDERRARIVARLASIK